jgi:hypothetical protein
MQFNIHWSWVEDDAAPEWDDTQCLFALADPESDEILYLGATGDATVRARCEAAELEPLWAELRGIGIEQVGVLVGRPTVASPAVAPATVAAAAALLVSELQPSGNGAELERGIEPAHDLAIECSGDWPYEETHFTAV